MFKTIFYTTLTLAICAAPAFAQQQQQNTNYAPLYNTNSNSPVYYSSNNGTVPIYNNANNTPVRPMEQMIAGKNAPSYDFNKSKTQPYLFGTNQNANAYTGYGVDPNLQLQQNQYNYQDPYAQQMAQQTGAYNYGAGMPNNSLVDLSKLQGGPFGTQTQDNPQRPTKRRVVYKERNNPLVEPPRLFNPDQ